MKAQMKKISILAFHKDRTEVVEMLQELGVIHLEINRNYRDHEIEALEREEFQLKKVLEAIQESVETEKVPLPMIEGLEVEQVKDQVLDLGLKMDADVQELEVLAKERLVLSPWGHFDRARLEALRDHGIRANFFMAHQRAYHRFNFGELQTHKIHQGGKRVFFVILSKGDLPELPFDEVVLPARSLSEVEAREQELTTERGTIKKDMGAYRGYLNDLQAAYDEVKFTLTYYQANGSFAGHSSGAILSIRGWFPASIQGRLEHYLNRGQITYAIDMPAPGDQVPVLLRNSRLPKLFESITNIFQLPNYYELDLTPFIAVFYPIFFAYCLGDAGYGIVLLVAAIIAAFTFLRQAQNIAVLGMILGLFTTVMGVVKSGSVFGIPLAGSENPMLAYLARFVFIHDDRSVLFNAFNVALMVGVVQIFVGVMLAIINKLIYEGFTPALPVIGKLMIITSAIWMFLAGNQGVAVLQSGVGWMKFIGLAGIVLVVAFHDLSIPLGRRIPAGLLPLFFIFTGLLGDTLSYVRLFALGVASAVLGLVVNQIGMQIMGDGWLSIGIGVLFLLFGHALNFALATLGAFVHPLRLTFVEFYGNAQFQGGGVPYQPFRKRLKSIVDYKQ